MDLILWSDPDLIVVNKPSGLRVVPDGYVPSLPTLAGLLQPEWGRLWTVHRLDKDTSGVMLFARNAAAHRNLDRQFANRQVQKVYMALVAGEPDWISTTIDQPLRVNADRQHRTTVDTVRGKPARTSLRVVRRSGNYSLLEVRPHTGYTHQIRAHLSFSGFPLLGDPLYHYPPSWNGPRKDLSLLPPFPRTALHARQITFLHPLSSIEHTFLADFPEDFRLLLSAWSR